MDTQRKIYKKWFRSMLTVISAILLVVILLCLYLVGQIRNNALLVSEDTTKYMMQSVDSRLDEIRASTVVFELNAVNTRLKKANHISEVSFSEVYPFCDQISNFKISNNLVAGVLLYYPKLGYIAGDLGFYPASSYFLLLGSSPLGQYGAWRQQAGADVGGRGQFLCHTTEGTQRFYYLRDLYFEGEIVGTILVEILLDELLTGAQKNGSEQSSASSFGVLAGDEAIIFSASDAKKKEMETFLNQPIQAGSNERNHILVYIQASRYQNLRYFVAYRQTTLFRPIYIAIGICIAGILVCLGIGIYFSSRISAHHATPIEKILTKVSDGSAPGKDEYQYISLRIDEILREKFKSEEKQFEQQYMIDSLFLSSILRGELHDEYAVFGVAKQYDILFEYPVYQAAVLQLAPGEKGVSVEEIREFYQGLHQEVIAANLGDKTVIIFNTEEPVSPSQAMAGLGALLEQEFAGCRVSCGIGRGYDTMVDIFTSYKQALLALPPNPQNPPTVRYYNQRFRQKGKNARQGIFAMEVFIKQLSGERYESAKACLDEVFTEYLHPAIPPEELVRRITSLQNLLADELSKQQQVGTAVPKFKKLQGAISLPELQSTAERVLSFLCEISTLSADDGGTIPERARRIIQQNFADSMLGLYMISDRLRVSNTYLSTSFKNAFGVGVVQYINQLRIGHAKDLILSTNLSIKEIAQTVGFASDISFIRVFKKMEQKTPLELRRANTMNHFTKTE